MDPEPGRCRRTDGYKWRCRKDVVPDSKYCERHMHRGRSRKHVETSKITLQLNTPTITYSSTNTPTTTCSTKNSQKIKSHDPDGTSAKVSTPVLENQQNKVPSLSKSKGLTCTATTMTNSSTDGKSKTISEFVENDKSSRDDHNGVGAGSDNIKDKNNKGNSTDGDGNGGRVTPELSISPKITVVNVTVSSNNVCKDRGVIAKEPQRCKRTDGKRWQCSNEAIFLQKYCGSHMHRGSKRCRPSSEAEVVTTTPAALVKPKSDHTNLNTDLSISPVKCPQPIIIDLDSSTSGSSDAATITDTDENTSASHILS